MTAAELLGQRDEKCWGVMCDGLASHEGGVAILLMSYYAPKRLYTHSTPSHCCHEL